jgi:hypothetical protein
MQKVKKSQARIGTFIGLQSLPEQTLPQKAEQA